MTESLRAALGLPSWIPENMVYALAAQKEQAAMAVVDPRQDAIREKIRIAPGNSTKTLLGNFWYQTKYGIYPDFQWKNILDIGGGFGWVAPILGNSAKQITVVDPVFREDNYNELYLEDIWRIERLMTHLESWVKNISAETQSLRTRNHNEQKQVQRELLWWKEYDPNWEHSHIKRNASYGENIEWIPDNSIDVIFINYVLSKKTVHPEDFLKEIQRVLKPNGYIIVSDNDMTAELLNQLFWSLNFQEEDILENKPTCFIAKGRKKG